MRKLGFSISIGDHIEFETISGRRGYGEVVQTQEKEPWRLLDFKLHWKDYQGDMHHEWFGVQEFTHFEVTLKEEYRGA